MEWMFLVNSVDLTDFVISANVGRENAFTGSTISGSVVLALPAEFAAIKRCDVVTFHFNSNFPDTTPESMLGKLEFLVKQVGVNSENNVEIEFAQINGMGLSKAPVIGAAQTTTTQTTAKRAGEIAASMLADFGVSSGLSPFGLPQYDLQGSNESDPFSQVGGICNDHGLLPFISNNNGGLKTTGLSSLVNKSPALYPPHVLEFTSITQPELDEILVVGLQKTLDNGAKVSYTEREEIRDDQTGELKEIIITEVDEFGLETRKVATAMRYLRPDTHPNSGLMISAEETWEEVKTDAQNRITKSIKYSNKNTAVISPESGNDSILIPAERVETTYRFNTTTNEITSILIETYQVFVIGKREAYTYTAGTLKPLKTSQKTLPSTNSESPLSDADKEVTVISPLVLARTERTTYRKLGNNKWRETITVTARGLNSETKTGTSEKGDTVGRITTLGGMQTIQSKSKIVYSVPTAQKSDSPERELKEQVFRNLLKPTVSNPCSTFMTRREQVEINSNIDAAAFGQACALIRIDKLSPTVAGSLRCNSASIRALCAPFSTLVFDDALWVVSNISLSISAGAALDFAGDFKQIKNGVSTVDCPPIPPPKVEVTSLGDVFVLPVKINNFPVIEDVEFELPQTTNQPMPLKSAASGENVPPTALPATLQTDGTNTYLTQPGKLSVLSLDTAQVTTSPTPDFTVVSVVGGTALTPPQITDAPTTITLPPLLLEEEVFTLPITVSVNLLVESVLVELWEEKEILVNSQFFGVVDVTIADSDITVSAPFFPVN